jgi:NADH-quinone oxidoreductase subunit L
LELVWLIPALPLAGFLVLLAAGRHLGEPRAGWLATLTCAGSFAATVVVAIGLQGEPGEERRFVQTLFSWVPAGGLDVDMGFLVDPLSITMALFVTGVSTLIHLYSIGYMHGDGGYSTFFVYLNLFVFSMLMLVLGSNLLVTFLGWEGVGACSYWLISFWFTKDANATAGKKAFVTNRIGDWGFMVAMFLAFGALGTLDYTDLIDRAGSLAAVTATGIALLLFLGAVGKSAQLPLYLWLPDAMAGPTPVSALIHAATMVTAGVFLMTRVSPVLAAGYDWVPDVIAWVGAVTALFAATIAVGQNDIKKVLAYSTVSQLGYMFLAVGLGAYVAAIFHMVTHAFFKALLFLGSGSVIHGLDDEQDMRRMGALRTFMPITATTFIIGWLAIAGVPPFAGFWSKDEVLLSAWASGGAGRVLWAIGLVTALLTALYMGRQVFMVFFGRANWAGEIDREPAAVAGGAGDAEAGEIRAGTVGEAGEAGSAASAGEPGPAAAARAGGHAEPHESPWLMTAPLVVLAVLAVVGGAVNLPFTDDTKVLEHWLEPVIGETAVHVDVATGTEVSLSVAAVAAGLVGIVVAALLYLRRRTRPEAPAVLARGWYYDDAVTAFVGGPGQAGFEGVAAFDRTVIDGGATGLGGLVRRVGRLLRHIQTGFVRSYALGVAAGVVVVLGYFLTRLSF